jgi:predicted site-specific integrase-resolvase
MLLTVIEFAERLKVDASTVRRWIRLGAFTKFITLPQRGRRTVYMIDEKELHKILDR